MIDHPALGSIYPKLIYVNSAGSSAEFYPEYLGNYSLVDNLYSICKPVWKKETKASTFYIFYDGCKTILFEKSRYLTTNSSFYVFSLVEYWR